MSSPEQHSVLGASNAARWMACPGSVSLSKDIEDVPSKYAEEGTLAHGVAEARINAETDAYLSSVKMSDETIVPSGMNEALDIYVKMVRELAAICDWYGIEQRFTLEVLKPPIPAFGTADFVGYIAEHRTLVIADLKYGSGLLVEVDNNVQLMYYAVGALLSFQKSYLDKGDEPPAVDQVRMVIVQPRAEHPDGAIRSATMPVEELIAFSIELLAAMHRTQEPNPELNTGPHCRFCRAAAICPELLRKNQATAKMEFADFPVDASDALAPTALTNEQIGHMLEKLDSIEHWVASVRLHAVSELERGRDVPGWKLVAKRATRQWKSEQFTHEFLTKQGVPTSEHYTRKIKSPRQVEITLGEYGITKANLPKELVTSESTGTKLARASSSAPAVTGGSEFFDE